MSSLDYCPTETAAEADDDGSPVIRGQSFGKMDKFSGRKKLSLTPELRRFSFGFTKTQCSSSDSKFKSLNGLEYLKNKAISLEENMELISTNILLERKHFQDFVNSLQSQVVQLEEKINIKSIKIENVQLYNSEKLKIINSLTTVLNEIKWKRDTNQKISEEHTPNKLYKSFRLVNFVSSKIAVFKSYQIKLKSYLTDLEINGPQTLFDIIQQLKLSLDECISVAERTINKELSDALMNEEDFNDTIKHIIYEVQNFHFNVSQFDINYVIEMIDLLKTTYNDENNLEYLIELWEIVKDLLQKNQCLANRITSMNMHKFGLQLQLDEMETSTKELELKTISEFEEVEKKQEILNQNESMIQQNWDQMDTSQEIILQTHRAQEIDQELEDLQIEYHSYDIENRQLKTDLFYLQNELTSYQVKCEQLEAEITQIEYQKNDVLEEYAKSWGHHNEKQKIKYTGRIIKDIDSITQEIKSLEMECEKYDPLVSSVKTSVFSKTQPKSDKTPRTFGVIDTNKRQNTNMFREGVVRKLRYQ